MRFHEPQGFMTMHPRGAWSPRLYIPIFVISPFGVYTHPCTKQAGKFEIKFDLLHLFR
jgi:hypothetical protein